MTSTKWAMIAKCSQDTAQRDIQALIEGHSGERRGGGGVPATRWAAFRLANWLCGPVGLDSRSKAVGVHIGR